MKIYFNHYSGSMTEYDYLFFDCFAEVLPVEENKALEEGWIPDDYSLPREDADSRCPFPWYQARQTRLKISNFHDNSKTRKIRRRCGAVTTEIVNAKDANKDELCRIFDKYINYKKFESWEILRLIKSNLDRKKIYFI